VSGLSDDMVEQDLMRLALKSGLAEEGLLGLSVDVGEAPDFSELILTSMKLRELSEARDMDDNESLSLSRKGSKGMGSGLSG
jgi:hypothetical protein